jgi:hypothetical protein
VLPPRQSGSNGSTPIELVVWLALLIAPLGPMLSLYGHLSDQLAAESIARHALRGAVLTSTSHTELIAQLPVMLHPLASSWNREVRGFELSCGSCARGEIITLRVFIGNATGVQSAALNPK